MTGRRVVCAAVRDTAGRVFIGPRHYDPTMRAGIEAVYPDLDRWDEESQGFIDQHGQYLTREEAFAVASAAGQIIRRCGVDDGRLFSENLY